MKKKDYSFYNEPPTNKKDEVNGDNFFDEEGINGNSFVGNNAPIKVLFVNLKDVIRRRRGIGEGSIRD